MLSISRFRLILAAGVAVIVLLSVSSCQTVSYYSQAVSGQYHLWRAAKPIDTVIDDKQTSPALRQRLELVTEITTFATRDLGLPDNGSYQRYADLGRPYVLWNVFAAPAFSLEPVTWCFPIAGCVGYRGYFSEKDAQQFATGLRDKNLDIYVGGVPAYSTLGWLDDAVLNTFINYSDADLARLIFHELAHQRAYAPGDTTFNESFANTVELEGVRRWLVASGRSDQLAELDVELERQQQFIDLVMRTRDKLAAIYQSGAPEEEMLKRKVDTYSQLQTDYQALKQKWGGYSGYDRWFAQQLNNAKLASVVAYNQLVPAFQRLLAKNDGDLNAFYEAVIALTKLTPEQRRARLDGSEVACPACAPDGTQG
jgi:predicted aminopeptidase